MIIDNIRNKGLYTPPENLNISILNYATKKIPAINNQYDEYWEYLNIIPLSGFLFLLANLLKKRSDKIAMEIYL